MDVGIRRATPADALTLADVAEATFALACPPGTTTENIERFIADTLSAESFGSYLARDDYRLWLALCDGHAIGYAMAVHGEPDNHDIARVLHQRPTVELSKIYVRDTHHGTGVATGLMDTAIEEARGSGAASIWLGVNQHNARANRFYEKHGFVLRGTRSFPVGDTLEDDFVRERELLPPGA